MLNFIQNQPTKILFGKDQVLKLGSLLTELKPRVLLVYGGGSIKKSGLYDQVIKQLNENKIFFAELSGVKPNPSIESVREGIKISHKHKLNFILAVGGGSVIDAAKAMAAGFYCKSDAWDLFIGKAKLTEALPVGTVLTLAATGTEMNGNSVVSNPETAQKYGIRSAFLKPVFSILDPVNTYTVDKYQTAAGISDIMAHVFEQYFSNTPGTYLSDRMSESVLRTCVHYAQIVLKKPTDYEARANIMWAGTVALNETLTYGKVTDWATHMIEHEISAIYDLTHGAGLAILFPNWMKYVLHESNYHKFVNIGYFVFDMPNLSVSKESALAVIERIRSFFNSIGMPSTLQEAGIGPEKLEEMANKTAIYGELGNLKKLNTQDVLNILNMSK